MENKKTTFALFFGNRGFFPASLIAQAREELPRVLRSWGHDVIMLDEEATRYGAVETRQEGERYANFLRENRGKFGGVIVSLPNFGDEFGAVTALKEAEVPILIQAEPDTLCQADPLTSLEAVSFRVSDERHLLLLFGPLDLTPNRILELFRQRQEPVEIAVPLAKLFRVQFPRM